MRKGFSLLAVISAMLFAVTAQAANVGVLTIQGKEKFKVSRCGGSSVRQDVTIRLNQKNSWDLYDELTQSYALNFGAYKGSLTSRKIYAYFGTKAQTAFINTLASAAEDVCASSDIEVTSYKPKSLYYTIKINKNRTKASMKTKVKLKGYDWDRLQKGKGSYEYSGKGVYSIQRLAN